MLKYFWSDVLLFSPNCLKNWCMFIKWTKLIALQAFDIVYVWIILFSVIFKVRYCHTCKAIHEYSRSPHTHQMTCALGQYYWFLFCCIYQSERYIIWLKDLVPMKCSAVMDYVSLLFKSSGLYDVYWKNIFQYMKYCIMLTKAVYLYDQNTVKTENLWIAFKINVFYLII